MYPNGVNEGGCPIHNQSGSQAIQGFDTLLASFSPELRAAFEAERAACQQELDAYFAANPATS